MHCAQFNTFQLSFDKIEILSLKINSRAILIFSAVPAFVSYCIHYSSQDFSLNLATSVSGSRWEHFYVDIE